MSRFDENDLISKFVSALTVFGDRSAALETRVLSELESLRKDVNQLRQTILNESPVVPQVMEQQRLTMIELIRQIQPILAASQPIQHAPIQPPTIAVAPTQQPIAPVQQSIAPVQQPIAPVQTATRVVPPVPKPAQQPQPVQAQTNVTSQGSGFGEQFKLKAGEWYCSSCYVKNEPSQSVCVCCQTPKTGEKPSTNERPTAFKPQTFNSGPTNLFSSPTVQSTPSIAQNTVKEEKPSVNFSFATNKSTTASPSSNLFAGGAQKAQEQKPQTPVSFSFAPNVAKSPSTTVPPQENKSLFGTTTPATESKPLFGGGSNTSFASLAGNTSGNSSFLNKNASNANTFNVDPKQFALFSGGNKGTPPATRANPDEDDETAPEEFVPDESQFKRPDIALPDLIEVKTGEENEEVLFSARCRLYRFIPGSETKERGTGDLKILKSRETGKVRCVMRREQVLKLCANFGIPAGFTVTNTKKGENVLTWACRDYSDPETPDGENMTLICRFKDVDTANNFKTVAQSAAS